MSELDEIFREFARAFVGTTVTDREIACPERLERNGLDGTHESLQLVDRYLEYLHEHRERLEPLEWDTTVLWGGAYIGEVIRNARPGKFSWVDYNEYMPAHPKLLPLVPERTVATCAFLVGADGGMSMPLNKVARFIEEGPENSVHFFAHCDIAKFPEPETEKRSWWSRWLPKRSN